MVGMSMSMILETEIVLDAPKQIGVVRLTQVFVKIMNHLQRQLKELKNIKHFKIKRSMFFFPVDEFMATREH